MFTQSPGRLLFTVAVACVGFVAMISGSSAAVGGNGKATKSGNGGSAEARGNLIGTSQNS